MNHPSVRCVAGRLSGAKWTLRCDDTWDNDEHDSVRATKITSRDSQHGGSYSFYVEVKQIHSKYHIITRNNIYRNHK